jgi:hypothetical protein
MSSSNVSTAARVADRYPRIMLIQSSYRSSNGRLKLRPMTMMACGTLVSGSLLMGMTMA